MIRSLLAFDSAETTENISDGGFAIAGGNDLYVEDMLGVNGNPFFDGTSTFVGNITATSTLIDLGGASAP